MQGAASTSRIIRFHDYEVDLPAGHLRKRGVKVRLRDQSFDVLAMLLEHPGEVVTREDLRKRLWPADVFVDFDNNLNTAIGRLREVLSDSAEHPRFIETLPKRGYRFIAALSEPPSAAEQPLPRRLRLVVLPFTNLTGDPAQEYFGDAMTEEVITALAALTSGQLGVIARTTAMHYKSSRKDIVWIGRELGAGYVVEGSVRRTEDRVAICAQLINAGDQTHLWAKKYDIELRDIFGIATVVAQEIAAQIGITTRPAARKPTEDLAAYNLYLEGRYHLYKWTPEGIAKAQKCLGEAIARDPNFALAYDSLAEVYWWIGFLGLVRPKEAFSAAVLHALRAVEIDNTLAETHALLAMCRKELDYNWPEVHREMGRALELNPASPVVRFRYALSGLMPHGRHRESAAEIERALESDPLSLYMRSWLAEILYLAREYDRALEQARQVVELDATYYLSHFVMGQVRSEQRMFEEAIPVLQKAAELSGGHPLVLGWLGLALAQSGNTAEARALLQRLQSMSSQAYVLPTTFAWIHLGLGEIDDAFAWMDRAVEERDAIIIPIKSLPFLDPLRSDPRYLALLRKMNLEP